MNMFRKGTFEMDIIVLGFLLLFVSYPVLHFQEPNYNNYNKACINAMKEASVYKAALNLPAKGSNSYEAVKAVCSPCYNLDVYFIKKSKKTECSKIPSLNEILHETIDDNLNVDGKNIDKLCLPNYYKCLTIPPEE